MTVCIGAICTDPATGYQSIILASDRRYTIGDHWVYEPFQTKHFKFSDHVVGLISGNVADSISMCVRAAELAKDESSPTVETIANDYAMAFAEHRRRQAERGLLDPIGLTLEQLTTDERLPESLVTNLIDEVRRWELQDAALIAGIDQTTNLAHLYTVTDPGWASCEDVTGFTAVGSGADHAMAEFMRRSYSRTWTPASALVLAFTAKKAAEVDPFVGAQTDIHIIGPGHFPYAELAADLRPKLDSLYYDFRLSELQKMGETFERFDADVQEFLKNQSAQGTQQQEASQTGPDEGEIPGSSAEGEPAEG